MSNVQYDIELNAKLDKIDGQISGVEKRLDSRFKQAGASSGNAFVSGMTPIVSGIGGIIASFSFVTLGKQALTTAGNLQIAQLKYETLLKSADKAKDRVAEIVQFAKETPFQQDEVIKADTLLQGFGIRTKKNLQIVGNAASISGSGISDLSLILGQLSQSNSLENIKQLAERGVVTFDELKEAGISFAKDGSIINSTEETFTKVLGIIDKKFEGGSAKISKTLTGQLSTAVDGFNISLGKLATQSGAYDLVTNILGQFNKLVEENPIIASALGGIAIGVSALSASLLFLGGPATLIIGGIIAAVSLLALAWNNNFGGIQEKTKAFVDYFTTQIMPKIKPVIDELILLVTNIFTMVKPGLERLMSFFGDKALTIAKIFNGVVDVVRGVLEVINGLFAGDGKKISDGFGKIFGGLGQIVKQSMNSVIENINLAMSGFNTLGNAFEKLSGGKVNVADIPQIPKLAQGGSIIPPGYNNDTFPLFGPGGRLLAMAQSGEKIDVVPRNQVSNNNSQTNSGNTVNQYYYGSNSNFSYPF